MAKYRPADDKALQKQKSGQTLSYNEKRVLTHNKLLDMGFSPAYARANRNNFNLVSDKKTIKKFKERRFRQIRKTQISKIVRKYYHDALGYSKADANKLKGRRLKVWDDTLKFLRVHEIKLETEFYSMPDIPQELYKHGADLLLKNFHYLNPKEDEKLDSLEDQLKNGVIDAKTHELKILSTKELLHHNYRLHRFIVTQDDDTVKKFVETLNKQSDLDDYYTKMDASYKAPSKEPMEDYEQEMYM